MLLGIHYPSHIQMRYKTMYFENYCKVLLSIDKKVFYREQFANASTSVSANVSRMEDREYKGYKD